jgi:hypothetical protein
MLLVLSMTLLGVFVINAALFEQDIDDDDEGPGGGMMIPVPQGI